MSKYKGPFTIARGYHPYRIVDAAGTVLTLEDIEAELNAPQSRVSDDTHSGGAVAKAWMVTLCDGRTTEDRVYQHEGHADRMVTDWMLPGRAEYGYSAIIVPLYPHPPITTGGCYRKCGGGSLDYCTVHSGLFIDNAATRCDAAPSAPVAAPVQAEDVVCITKESLARVDDVPWERPIEPSAPPSAAARCLDKDCPQCNDALAGDEREPWHPEVLWPDDKLAAALRADADCADVYQHPGQAALLRRAADFVERALSPTPAEGDKEEAAKWFQDRLDEGYLDGTTTIAPHFRAAIAALRRPVVDERISKRIRSILAYLPSEESTDDLIERLVDAGVLRVFNEDDANLYANLYYTVMATEDDWPNGWHLNPVAALTAALAGEK